MSPVSVVKGRVNHRSCIQHWLEVLDLCINLLTIFKQHGCELVDDHPRSQGIVSWSAVDLFSLVLDQTEFLVDRL
jgi:hypothetical protein